MTRYRTAATRASLQITERFIWDAYYARECQRRRLRLGVDSLLTRDGRVVPLADAAQMNIGNIETIAGVEVLIVPGADDELAGIPEVAALVERSALPQSVRDELDQREQNVGVGRGVGRP